MLCWFWLFLLTTKLWAISSLEFTVKSPEKTPNTALSKPYEAVLKFKYRVSCRGSKGDEIRGKIKYQGRVILVDLYRYRYETEVDLGTAPLQEEKATLEWEPTQHCHLEKIQTDIKYEDISVDAHDDENKQFEKLAIKYSPFLNLRENQYDHPPDDVPLLLVYSIHPTRPIIGGQSFDSFLIRYTAIFSDENNQATFSDTSAQLAKYGRTTDIEWVYEIELNNQLEPIRENYQGFLHQRLEFHGESIPSDANREPVSVAINGFHRLIYNYNIYDNNLFTDIPKTWFGLFPQFRQNQMKVGHHLVPRHRVNFPEAREEVQFLEPWIFNVSEFELKKEGKLFNSLSDQLFVLIHGGIYRSSFSGEIALNTGSLFRSGGQPCEFWRCAIGQIGMDMWGEQSYSAIPIGQEQLDLIEKSENHGKFQLKSSFFAKAKIENLKFIRLIDQKGSYQPKDISNHFTCQYQGIESHCKF